ncbi:non-ribosomal peptide synthetase [Actinosynnema sp. NPDC047251]|uniref:Non-ribosomal peptide synthetase n=1 Tax=Saccharothrix espanaensis (strain ATCC 51144 / DSM 44229 / JCM 9112 / NBRC 15066 / NRRL 15764) TaxID=1179773 RepID=K0K7U4_SACES|nr:non-ribosomal peptide synthetase [Saccharothrix espanaensis]CCH32944.1 Non-ribosomal peptide synthetase [Saccharothrix espanaensis DSM 44229]
MTLNDRQYALWFGRELESAPCHRYVEWALDTVDAERLRRRWAGLVRRHPALRTSVGAEGTTDVARPGPVEVPVLDLSGARPDVVGRALDRLRAELGAAGRDQPADLVVSLLPGGRGLLHLRVDLIVADEHSVYGLLGRELLGTVATGNSAPVPECADLADARAYWLARLDELPPAPDLPRLPGATGHEQARELAQLPRARWRALRERAAEHGVTPEDLLLAAVGEVLRRWSKGDRFTVVCPVPGAARAEVGNGDTAVLTALDETGGVFADRARAAHRQREQDLAHRAFDGARVLREVNRRNGTRSGFPVVVDLALGVASDVPEPALSRVYEPHVDLAFRFRERAGGLRCEVDHRERVFPPGLVADLTRALDRLLHGLAADPALWSDARPVTLPPDQLARRALVNATDAPPPESLLHQAIAAHAQVRPEAPAVLTATRRIDYRELDRRVNQVGRRLRHLGARPNRLVAVVMAKGWEQVVAAHGVLAAGAAYLPIDHAVPGERLRELLARGEVDLVLTQRRLAGALDWPEQVRVLCVDDDFDGEDGGPLDAVQQPDDLAYVIFTSGSTGRPKGVAVDHRGALNTIRDINPRFGVGPDDRCLAVSGLHFDLSVYDVFGILDAGGAVVLPDSSPNPDPGHWAELVSGHGVTFWNSVPPLLEMLLTYLEADGRTGLVDPLRLVILAGDWIPVTLPGRVWAANPAVRVIGSGGPAESCVWSVINPVDRVDPESISIPLGVPMTNQSYHVLGPGGAHRPDWVPGEIHISSAVGLAQGYWRDPERTEAAFHTDPDTGRRCYASGDLGRYLPDGRIEILGREDFQVKIQGVRIELGEVEAALTEHPSVRAAVVVATGRSRDLRVLHAFVLSSGRPVDPAALRAFLAGKLPSAMVPPFVTALAEFPLTRNGKVDRLALAARPVRASLRRAEPVPTPLQRAVSGLFGQVLAVGAVAQQDDFFLLGGDSVRAVDLVVAVKEVLGVDLPPTAVFAAPTPAALAERIAEG